MEPFPVIEQQEEEISAEMMKLKVDLDDVVEQIDRTKFNLVNRSDSGFTEFMDEDVLYRLRGVVAELKIYGLYSDKNFEKLIWFLGITLECIGSIEMRYRGGGINDDVDSLINLSRSIRGISETMHEFEMTARTIEGKDTTEIIRLANEISDQATIKANYIAQRAEALASYGGR
jgi:hypothetical protein